MRKLVTSTTIAENKITWTLIRIIAKRIFSTKKRGFPGMFGAHRMTKGLLLLFEWPS